MRPEGSRELQTESADLRQQLKIAYLALENSLDGILVHTPQGRLLFFNDASAEGMGLSREEFAALPPWGFSAPQTATQRSAKVARIKAAGSLVFHSRVSRPGGERVMEVHATYVEGDEQQEPVIISVTHDVTESIRAHEILKHRAFHDSLTGLANRALFDDRLELAIAGAQRHGHTLGLAYIDVDEFKLINDRHGHEMGDRVLIALGERLERGVRQIDTVARFGGDEFVLIFPEMTSGTDLSTVASKLEARLAEPLALDGNTILVSSSVGSALFDPLTDDARSLIMRADISMYDAKRARAAERSTTQ